MNDKTGTLSKPTFQAVVERKSLHLIRARESEAANNLDEAKSLYLSVAQDEEWIASQLLLYASGADAAVNLLSAASCWKKAGHYDKAVELLDQILTLSNVPNALTNEVRALRSQWLRPASSGLSNISQEEMIARRAYDIYLERGGSDGSDVDDWLLAENELLYGYAGTSTAEDYLDEPLKVKKRGSRRRVS